MTVLLGRYGYRPILRKNSMFLLRSSANSLEDKVGFWLTSLLYIFLFSSRMRS